MCDPAQIPYKPDDIVWVKLSNVWWPAQVQDPDKLEKDVTEGLKKTPLVIVKFFNEDTYEYIRNLDQIYHYNCIKKNEFLQKGLDLCRPNSNRSRPSSMGKFPDDVKLAEEISGGNPDICNDPMFKHDTEEKRGTPSPVKQAPETKSPKTSVKRARNESASSPPKKRNRNSLPSISVDNTNNVESTPVASSSKTEVPATVPRRRRKPARNQAADSSPSYSVVHQDLTPGALRQVKPEVLERIRKKNYQANIRIQPSPSPSMTNVQEYICYRCNDKTNRLSRLIEHYRAHDKHGMNVPPMTPTMITTTPLAVSNPGPSTVDSFSTPKTRREKPKSRSRKTNNEGGTPAKKKVPKEETPKSEPVKKNDTDTVSKKKLKKTLKSKTVEADRNKVLRENILKDWDESDDESANDSKVFSTTAEVHFPSSRQTEGSSESLGETSGLVDSDRNLMTENNTASPSTLDIPNAETSSVNDVDNETTKKKVEQSPEIPTTAVENKGEEEKSCFDFEEDLEEAINLDKSHKFGQKLPRVINEEKLNKSVNSSNASDAHQIIKSEEESKILENKIQELLENTKVIEVPKIPDISLLPKRRSSRIRERRNVSFIQSDEDVEDVSRNEERSVADQAIRSSKDETVDMKKNDTSVAEDLDNTTSESIENERITDVELTNKTSEKLEAKEVLERSNEKIDNSLITKNSKEPVSKKEVENTDATAETCEPELTKDENDSTDKRNLQENDEENFKIDLEDEYIEVVSPTECKGPLMKQLIKETNHSIYDNLSEKECKDKSRDQDVSSAVEEMKESPLKEEKEMKKEQVKGNLMCLTRKEKNEVMVSEGNKEILRGSQDKEEMESEETKENLMDLTVKEKEIMKCEESKEMLMDLSVKEEGVLESEESRENLLNFPKKSKEEKQNLVELTGKEENEVESERKPGKVEEVIESEDNRERIMDLSVKEGDLVESNGNEENSIKSKSVIMDLSVKEEDLIESKEIKENSIDSRCIVMDLSVKEEDLMESEETKDVSEENLEVKIDITKEQGITDVLCDKCPSIGEAQISMQCAEEESLMDKKITGELEETLDKISFEKRDKLSNDAKVLDATQPVFEDINERVLNHNKIEINSSDSDVNSNDVHHFKEDIANKLTEKIIHEQSKGFIKGISKNIEPFIEVASKEERVVRRKDNLNEDENKIGKLVPEEVAQESMKMPSVESEQKIVDERIPLEMNDDKNIDISESKSFPDEVDAISNDLQSKEEILERPSEVNVKFSKNLPSSEQPLKNDKHYPVLEIGNYSNEMSSDIHQWTAMEYYADLEAQVRNDFSDEEPRGLNADLSKNDAALTKEVTGTQSKSELVSLANSNNSLDEDFKSKNVDNSQAHVDIKDEINDSPSKTADCTRSRVIYDFKSEFPEHTVNEIPPKLTKSKKRKWETKEPDDKLRENESVNKNLSEKIEDLQKEDLKQSEQFKITVEKTCEAENLENKSKKMKLDIGELMKTNAPDELERNISSAEVRDEITIPSEPDQVKEIIVRSEDMVQPLVCQELSSTPSNTSSPTVEVNKDTVSAETISVISCISKKEEPLSDTNMQLNFTTLALNSGTDKKGGITPFDPSQLELDINSMPVVIEEDLIQDIKLPTVTSVASSSSSRSNHKQIRIQLRKAGENPSSLLQGAQNGKIIRIPGTSKEPTVTKKVQLPSTSKVQTVTTIHSQRAIATGNQAVMLKVPIQGTGQTKYTVSKNQIRAASLAPAGTSGHPVKLQIIPQGPHQSAKLVMQPQQKPFTSKLAPRVVIKNQSGALGLVSNQQLPMTVKPGQKVNINQKRIISSKNIITKTSPVAVTKAGAVSTQKNAKSVVVTKPGITMQTSKTVLPSVQGTSVASAVQVVSTSVPSKVIMRRAKSSSATIGTVKSLPSQKGAIFIQTSQGLVPASKTVTKQIMQQIQQPQFQASSSAQRPSQTTTSNMKRVPVNKSRQANVNILKGNQKKVNRQQIALQGQLPPQHSKQQVLSIPATSISSHELILNNVPLQFQNIATAQPGDVKMLYLVDERGQYHQVDNSPLIAIDNSGENKNVFIESNSGSEVDNFLLAFGDTGVNVSTATTTPSQDILAKALANTQVLQSDTSDIGDTLEGTTLYVEPQFPAQPTLAHNVLETSFSLNPPIMTPLEVPSSVTPQVTSIASTLIPSSTVDTIVQNKKPDAQPSMPLLTDDVDVGSAQTVYLDSSGGLVTATTSQPLTFQVINSDGNIVASSDEILQKRLIRDDLNDTKESSTVNQETTVCQNDKSVSSFTFSSQTTATDNETKFIVEEKR